MKKAFVITAVLLLAAHAAAEVPGLIGFQGQLTENSNPVDGEIEISFKIYNVATGGSPMWTEVQTVTVEDGRYSVLLGSVTTLEGLEFFGDRWLALQVTGQSEMAPRYRLATSPFSMRSRVADSASNIPSGLVDSTKINEESISLLNISGGSATIGQSLKWNGDEWAPDDDLTGTGYDYWYKSGNRVWPKEDDDSIAIGTIWPEGVFHAVGRVVVEGALVGGVDADVDSATSVVAGGTDNWVKDVHSFIGGGEDGIVHKRYGVVCGGLRNEVQEDFGFVGSGIDVIASGNSAVAVGGETNTASGWASVIGGGANNYATGGGAVIAGGRYDSASASFSVVGGGYANHASGTNSTIPGGYLNQASGGYSFAAGTQAEAAHLGSFVWSDSQVDSNFTSTGADQFLVEASGGVGINTNSPAQALDVNGNIRCVSLTQTSDARFKKNIRSIDQPLAKLMSLHGVRFDWDQEAQSAPNLSDRPQIGLIAQDVEEQFPELVTTDQQGFKSVDYAKLSAVLLEAIRELNTRVAELEQDRQETKFRAETN